jgi:hypothetical protein
MPARIHTGDRSPALPNDLINQVVVRALVEWLKSDRCALDLAWAKLRHFSEPTEVPLEQRFLALLASHGFSVIQIKDSAGEIYTILVRKDTILGMVDHSALYMGWKEKAIIKVTAGFVRVVGDGNMPSISDIGELIALTDHIGIPQEALVDMINVQMGYKGAWELQLSWRVPQEGA